MRSLNKYIDEALFSSASEFSKADEIDDDFVDLGLSVDWAKYNLGAKKETDSGHYYMWGSTKPNDNDKCSWENVPFNNSKIYFDQEYFDSVKNKVCPKGILAPEYDAAYQESKGKYRMPTKEEFDELINKTNHEWIKNYNNTNVNGMKFINKTDDDSFIFIPAAGYRCNSSTYSINTEANLWSVSININDERDVWNLGFYNNLIDTYDYNSCNGFPIRPVKDN